MVSSQGGCGVERPGLAAGVPSGEASWLVGGRFHRAICPDFFGGLALPVKQVIAAGQHLRGGDAAGELDAALAQSRNADAADDAVDSSPSTPVMELPKVTMSPSAPRICYGCPLRPFRF